ncbi:MAG: hypothetical protein MRJ68_14780 [Nitrospira sp.]|nr:hypothetical protein [Nitrospira sp.]
MLNPRLARFKHGDSVRQLHTRYGSLDPSALSIMWQLFLERDNPSGESLFLPTLRTLLSEGKGDTGTAHPPSWVRSVFPEDEVRLPLMVFRDGALSLYIEAAARRVDTRAEVQAIQRRLQGLGGRFARVKHRPGRDDEQQAIAAEIEQQRQELNRLDHWPKLHDPQLWWHWAIVCAYECLPRIRAGTRVSPVDVKHLCQWLSVPEIGLVCTLATIKAARRRFAGRDWFGDSYPTYLATPRPPKKSSEMDSQNATGTTPDEDEDLIWFTCHLCQIATTGTLLTLGKHLQQQHRIQLDHVELSEVEQVIRKKARQEILATWHELTESKEA